MNDPANLSRAEKPPLRARIAFGAAREPNLTMLVPACALFAFCLLGPVLLVVLTGERATARMMLVLAGFATFGWFVFGVLLIAPLGRRAASPAHIAAALHAATMHEREHLLHQMRERMGNAYLTDPLTIEELASLFRAIREEHGSRARQRAEQQDRAKRAQEDYLANLAVLETGRDAP